MRDALKELQNTVRIGVITGGDRFERQVAENIARQACEEITRLRAEVERLTGELDESKHRAASFEEAVQPLRADIDELKRKAETHSYCGQPCRELRAEVDALQARLREIHFYASAEPLGFEYAKARLRWLAEKAGDNPEGGDDER